MVPAVFSMPKSATTWATTGMMKEVIRTKEGVKQMTFLLGLIANAEVPPEVRPLLFSIPGPMRMQLPTIIGQL